MFQLLHSELSRGASHCHWAQWQGLVKNWVFFVCNSSLATNLDFSSFFTVYPFIPIGNFSQLFLSKILRIQFARNLWRQGMHHLPVFVAKGAFFKLAYYYIKVLKCQCPIKDSKLLLRNFK